MNVYVINPYRTTEPHFPIIGIISDYHSLIWNVQLYGLGYFEITLPATPENVSLLKEGRFLVREEDIQNRWLGAQHPEYKNCMIIRTVNIQYDADQGYVIYITGKSVKDILSQRIIWEPYEKVERALTGIIVELLRANVTNPVDVAQSLLTQAEDAQADAEEALEEAVDAEIAAYNTYTEAKTAYEQAVVDHGEDSPEAKAAKTAMDNAETAWKAATEANIEATAAKEKADQVVDYYISYAATASLRQIPYVTAGLIDLPFEPPMLTLSLKGENLGEWVENICTEYGLGWNIYIDETGMNFEFIVGTDKSSTVEFSPELDNLKNAVYTRTLETYRNSGLAVGEGEGTEQTQAHIGGSSGSSRFEEYIDTGLSKDEGVSMTNYKKMVRQSGISEITKLKKRETISGEIDTDGVYKIGEDFDLGDVVSVKLDNGISATTRLIEIIYADEASGTSVTGTFEEWEV